MMFAELTLFPEAAGWFANQVDDLFFFILAVVTFFTLLVAGLVFVFVIRYRRRSEAEVPKRVEGSLALELTWTVIPTVIALFIFYRGAEVYMMWVEPPPDALEVYVVGRQWMWHVQHPGGQREINQLHVPVDRPVRITLTSQDVIHSFFIPALRTRQDAIPGRYTTLWFEANRTGRFHLFCSEYCGTNHSAMIGEVVVLSHDAYQQWLTRGADDSLADKGRKLFLKLQCNTCHSGDAKARAPLLENVYLKRVPLHGITPVTADDEYLYESIRNPNAKVVAGFQAPSIMPPYGPELVDEEEMIQLLAFLRTLGPGETPPRVEDQEPPVRGGAARKEKER